MSIGLYAPIAGLPQLTSGRNGSGFEAAHPPKYVLDNNMDTYWKPDSFAISSVYVYVGVTTQPTTDAIALWIHNYNEDFTGKTFRVYSSTTDSGYTPVAAAQNIEDYRGAYSPVLLYPLPSASTDAYYYIEFDGFDAVPIGVIPEISGLWLLEDFALPHGHQKPVKNINKYHNRSTVTRSGIRFNSHAGIGVQRSLERQFIHSANTAQWFNLRDAYRAAKGTLLPVFAQIEHDSTDYHAMHFARPLTGNETGHQYHVTTPVFRELGFKRVPYKDRRLFPLNDTIGLWRLRDLNGIDESGLDNHFTTTNFTSDDFVLGITEQGVITAFKLAVNDYSRIAAGAPSVDFEMEMSDFTIEIWTLITPDLSSFDVGIFGKLSGSGGWLLSQLAGGEWSLYVSDGSNTAFRHNGLDLKDNKWHLITIVVDRTLDTMTHYLDGAFVVSSSISNVTGNMSGTSATLRFEGRTDTHTIWWDEICITKRKLTSDEILNRYNGRTMYGDWGM